MTEIADMTLDEMRPLLVEAMLPHVPFDGWSDKAVEAAAADLGLKPEVARLVFRAPVEMVAAMIEGADTKMAAALDTDEFRAPEGNANSADFRSTVTPG